MRDIKPYLPFYLGCAVHVYSLHSNGILHSVDRFDSCVIDFTDFSRVVLIHEIKPLLRNLSDMTEEEKAEAHRIYYVDKIELLAIMDVAHFELCRYLLSRGFDLFQLIPEGLALDSKLVNH